MAICGELIWRLGRSALLAAGWVLMLLVGMGVSGEAQVSGQSVDSRTDGVRTTLVIFSDKPMPAELWPALVAALRGEIASGAPELRPLFAEPVGMMGDRGDPNAGVAILRGDAVSGVEVHGPIAVFLHGTCMPLPRLNPYFFGEPAVSGPLGWVMSKHGQIEAFAHVDCTKIGQVLGQSAMALSADRRTQVMAGSIARVIVHEWVHIATQNPGHARRGITKAQFGVGDLVAQGE